MDKTITIAAALFIVIAVGCGIVILGNTPAQQIPQAATQGTPGSVALTVTYFYGAECPHCANVKPVIENLSLKYPQVNFVELEVWHNQTNEAAMNKVNTQLGVSGAGVPEVIVGTTALIGDRDIPAKLENLIQDELKKK